MSRPPVTLVRGDDAVLVRDASLRLVEELVGGGDRGLMLTEFAGDEYELAALVDAAQTPPFLTDRRIVVGRDLQRFKAAELAPLVGYLADPLDTTDLVLAWGDGRVPKALADAVAAAGGEVLVAGPASGKGGRREWFDAQLAQAGVRLDAGARRLLEAQTGDDVARVPAVLTTLVATFGPDARLGADDIAPYLGAAGSVPPWELTDAIDRGDVPTAVERLTRMLESGDRHPLQIMVTLTSHIERMLALSGSGARSERDAAALLGMKGSTFPARKALDGSRRLGPERLARAVNLLADADLDLRGNTAWSSELVMEVLVARLAQLNR
jgi:DNA polymerase-3 subunit delta